MNIIQRFTIKSMKSNFRWTLVTAIGIVISVAMMSGLATISSSFLSFMIEGSKKDGGNWHIQVDSQDLSNLSHIESMEHVSDLSLMQAVGFVSVANRLNQPYIKIVAMDQQAMKDFSAELVDGRLPLRSDEIVLSVDDAKGFKLNDRITLNVGYRVFNNELLDENSFYTYSRNEVLDGNSKEVITVYESLSNEHVKSYTLVGVIKDSPLAKSHNPYTVAMSGYDNQIETPYSYRISLKVDPLNRKNTLQILKELGTVEGIAFTKNSGLLAYYGVIGNGSTYAVYLGMIAIIVSIIMLASVALIYNAFSISLSQRTRQLGMLASVGATKHQKRSNVFLEAFYISTITIPLGLVSGIVGIAITLKFIEPLLAELIANTVPLKLVVWWQAIAIAALLSIITIFFSVWIPAKRASSMSVIDALSERKEVKISKRAVKTPKWIRTIFGFEGDLALKNLRRNKRKFRATVISLTLSMVLFVSVSYFMSSLSFLAKAELDVVNYDVKINLRTSSDEQKNDVINALKNNKNVVDLNVYSYMDAISPMDKIPLNQQAIKYLEKTPFNEMWFMLVVMDQPSFDTYTSNLSINPDSFKLNSHDFIALNMVEANMIQEARFLGKGLIEENTSMTVGVLDQGSGVEKSTVINLVGFTDKIPLGFMPSSFSRFYLITNEASVSDLLSLHESSMTDEYTFIAMTSEDDAALEKDIILLMEEFNVNDYYTSNMNEQYRSFSNLRRVMEIFMYGFITLISFISVMNIINTITTNVQIRRKEFAMLRSMGMTPKSFNTMIRFESLFYGLNAIALGIPISMGIIYLINKAIAQGFVVNPPFPYASFVFVFVVVFTIVIITMLFSVAHIRKDNIVDVLKMDN